MSKIPFSFLKLELEDDICEIEINNQVIAVKQYLPIEEKLDIITAVLQNSADDNNFANPVKLEVFMNLEILYAYTNIEITEDQKANPTALYDLLEANDVFNMIIAAIPEDEYGRLLNWTQETITAFYEYRTSVMGILEQVSADYSNLDFDASAIQKKLADGENVEFLKEVLTKLG